MTAIDRDWAESAVLNCVSEDGRSGFDVRLARYPGQGNAWLWVFVFLPDAVYGYNDDALTLTGFQGVTDAEQELVRYELPGGMRAFMERRGGRGAVTEASVSAAALAHEDRDPELGPGTTPVRIEATFRAAHPSVLRGRGRMEVLGEVRATIDTPRGTLALTGRGHWHEQHGVRPRFAAPFTYLTLRGERFGFVGTKTEAGAGGFVVRDGATTRISAIEVDPPGPRRAFRLALADGGGLTGTADTTHAFTVAVEGSRRPGALVRAATPLGPLSGLINDWAGERWSVIGDR